ncbi:membrane bound O-acyl transferase family domain-containing protein [Trichoderma compactum]
MAGLVNSSAATAAPSWLGVLRDSAASTGLVAPQFIICALLLTTIILLFPPRSLFRRALYLVQLYLTACAFVAPLPPGAPQADLYAAGLLIGGWAARILDRVYMVQEPEKAFLRKGVDDGPNGPETYGPLRKFNWAFEMIFSQRGVGWNWQVGGVPRPDYTTRWGFVANRVFRSLYTMFLVHMVSVLADVILAIDQSGGEGTISSGLAAVLRHPLFLRAYVTAGWLIVVYGHVALPENAISIVTVATGVFGRWSDPKLWPPMFNKMSEAYTLRRYWGKYWHAMLRRTTNAPGEFLLQEIPALRKPKSQFVRLARRYGLLFLSFAVSGFIHAAGSYMVTRDYPEGWSDGGAMKYFLVQPVAIVLEDALYIALGVPDDGNPGLIRRLVGYAYVTAWWLWCFPTLKVAPLAAAHRLEGWEQGGLLASVVACKELADAYPANFARDLWHTLGRA